MARRCSNLPKVATIALLANPDNQSTVSQAKDVQVAAQSLGREARIVYANSKETIHQIVGPYAGGADRDRARLQRI